MRERILLVEGDAQARDLSTGILAGAGYRCTATASLTDARELLGMAPFELLISDLRLPDGSGIALVEEAVAQHEHMAALVVSGLDEVGVARRALEAGAHGYIVKPFSANEVLMGVLGALRHRRAQVSAREEFAAEQAATIERLCLAAELRDDGVAPHLARVGETARRLARLLAVDDPWGERFRLAATMHDIGNVALPDRILGRPGPLTEPERVQVRRHPEIGYRILAGSRGPLLEAAATIAWTHHERWDGSGYPRALAGEEIPIEGRIVAVADVHDTLTRERPYRPAFSDADALQVIEDGRGREFDPDVVDALLHTFAEGESAPARFDREGDGPRSARATPRELEVLQLAADGHSPAEIAAQLVLSVGTVKTHFQNVYAKLGAHDRASAVAQALRRGLID